MIEDQNEFFRQMVVRICGTLDTDVAMERCYYYLRDHIPLDEITLNRYEPELNLFRPIATFSPEPLEPDKKVCLIPEDFRELWAEKWASLEPVHIINDPSEDSLFKEFCISQGWPLDFSCIVVRLTMEGRRIGSLALVVQGTGRYTREHAELVSILDKPFAIAMANALEHMEVLRLKDMLTDDNQYLRRQLEDLWGRSVIGADFGLKDVMRMVEQVSVLDSPVLLLGETGAGKGLIADAIHNASARRERPLVKVNCGAIPESLLDSELFGHEKGAFTGALSTKRGRFERADGGTIFLDEIGELPPQAQVRLLHVLQHREVERVGGTEAIPVDIRIISATHRNLEAMMRSGRFREDLWFRLNVFPIMIPPLRRRKEDIPALTHYFLEKKAIEMKLEDKPVLAPGALDRLMAYDWPGNVRELENIVERALIREKGRAITFSELYLPGSDEEASAHAAMDLTQGLDGLDGRGDDEVEAPDLSLDELNRRHIRHVLEKAGGRVNGPGGAAERLGIHPNTLRKRMSKLGIPFGRTRAKP